jgi:hypothetical protein
MGDAMRQASLLARPMRSDLAGVSAVLGTVLMLGLTIFLGTVLWLAVSKLGDDRHDPVRSGGVSTYWSDGYWVTPTGPDDIPVEDSRMWLVLDGVGQFVALADLPGLAGLEAWEVGHRICIVGPAAGCHAPTADNVQLTVYTRQEYVFALAELLVQTPSFSLPLPGGGGVVVGTTQPLLIENIGSAITCGASGPVMPVTAELTLDGGATYQTLFGGAVLSTGGGEAVTLSSVPVAAVLGVRGTTTATGGCSSATYASVPADPHVLVLRAGDPAPDVPAFGSQPELLEAFLQPYVNTFTSTMVLDVNQVILLFEFTGDLSSSAADFQDLVILFTFG